MPLNFSVASGRGVRIEVIYILTPRVPTVYPELHTYSHSCMCTQFPPQPILAYFRGGIGGSLEGRLR